MAVAIYSKTYYGSEQHNMVKWKAAKNVYSFNRPASKEASYIVAQFVEHHTVSQRLWVRIPLESQNFFLALFVTA